MKARAFAPAKINLSLHVTGRRADGYHLIDSLVGFAGVGDRVSVTRDTVNGLTVSGPHSDETPADRTNLVTQVADLVWPDKPVQIHLEKNLPVASGIGGGSADAAACLRALECLSGRAMDPGKSAQLLKIGADIPMCISSVPARIGGIGDEIAPLPSLPKYPIVLVNPRVAVSTASIFEALPERENPEMQDVPADVSDASRVLRWLKNQRNDLQDVAVSIVPEIGVVLRSISVNRGCQLSRMSGSGATCFGVFDTISAANDAAVAMAEQFPDWWIISTQLDGQERAAAQLIRSTT